jgi:hypothetical protein
MVGLLMLKQLENLSDERFISKTTKKDRVFYQNLVDFSVIYCGFIVINQFVVWFLRVD